MICIIFISITLPFNLAFQLSNDDETYWFLIIRRICSLIFIFDLIISVRTGYYENGLVCVDGKKIFLNWVKNLLWYKIAVVI